jgi:hypothetical protein
VSRATGHADRGVDVECRALDVDLPAQVGHDLLGRRAGIGPARETGEQHPEAVSLHAGHRVRRADGAAQPRGDLDQNAVATDAAERVVHVLEAVEAEDEQRRLLAARGRVLERLVGALEQQCAVRQRRHQIMQRQVLGLRRLLRRPVHRGHREGQHRHQVEPVLRDHRHRGAEREERGGGPAPEDEVAA